MPGIIRRQRVGIVDVNKWEDKEEITWCPNCEEAGAWSKMGKRIYTPNDQGVIIVPTDADKWLQCPNCGEIIPAHEGRGEGEVMIDPEFELVESGFDFGNAIIESVREGRRIDRSDLQLRAKKKQRKKVLTEIKDSDIKKELIEGGEITSYEISKV